MKKAEPNVSDVYVNMKSEAYFDLIPTVRLINELKNRADVTKLRCEFTTLKGKETICYEAIKKVAN